MHFIGIHKERNKNMDELPTREDIKDYICYVIDNTENKGQKLFNSIIHNNRYDDLGRDYYLIRPNMSLDEAIYFIGSSFWKMKEISYTCVKNANYKEYSYSFKTHDKDFVEEMYNKVKKKYLVQSTR